MMPKFSTLAVRLFIYHYLLIALQTTKEGYNSEGPPVTCNGSLGLDNYI